MRYHLLALLFTFLISTSFFVADFLTKYSDPITLSFLRFFISFIVLFMLVSKKNLKIQNFKAHVRYAILGFLYMFFFLCMFEALKSTTTINASVINTLSPFITAIFMYVVYAQKIQKKVFLILLIGLFGTLWVLFDGSFQNFLSFSFLKGDLLYFIGVISMAIYVPLIGKFYRGENIYHYTLYSLFYATLFLGICMIFYRIDLSKSLDFSLKMWAGIFYLSIFTTLLTYLIMQIIATKLQPIKIVAYGYLVPSFVFLINLVLGYERIHVSVIFGIFITFVVMVLLQKLHLKS